jgi:hypothetical protein
MPDYWPKNRAHVRNISGRVPRNNINLEKIHASLVTTCALRCSNRAGTTDASGF